MGFVYKWTNVLNGHWYIGSHSGTENDGYVGSGIAFKLAYAKYGAGAFSREILYRGTEFIVEERRILIQLNAKDDPNSYNLINDIGRGFLGKKHSQATKEHLRKLFTGSGGSMYGRSGTLSPTYGKRGEKCQNAKLTQVQANEIRKRLQTSKTSLKQLGKEFGVSRFTIARIRDNVIYTEEWLSLA